MATVMVYTWLCPLPSRRQCRGEVTVPDQEEILTVQVIFAPLRSWYTSGEPGEDHLQVRPYLHDVIRNVRAASQNFTQSLQYYATCEELATSVCEALLVIDTVQRPGVPKCIMCESPVAVWETPLGPIPDACEDMLRYPVSNGPSGARSWILDEITVYPSWRVDSPPKLCAFHSDEYCSALKSVTFGCVRFPGRSPVTHRSVHDSSSPSNPEAQAGPSSPSS